MIRDGGVNLGSTASVCRAVSVVCGSPRGVGRMTEVRSLAAWWQSFIRLGELALAA